MPLKIKKQGEYYILVEPSGKRSKHSGKFKTKKQALKQLIAIELNKRKNGKRIGES